MCTQPLHIKNPKLCFDKYTDKAYLDVPCGKCEECISNKILSYQIRAYYEYKNCVEKFNGCVYYYTLTYSNKTIPTITFRSRLDSSVFRFPCFSHRHIDNFVRNFKFNLAKSNPGLKMKIFLTSEYGGDTRRPHYHLLVYFYGQIPSWRVREIMLHSWVEKTSNFNSRPLGRIEPGENEGLVNSSAAVQYVAKYIGKSESYSDVERKIRNAYVNTKEYLDFCSIPIMRNEVPKDEYYQDILHDVIPFVKKSREFGSCVKDFMSPVQKKLGVCIFEHKTNGYVTLPLPLYLLRKLYYNTDVNEHGNVIYVLNEAGIERKLSICEKQIDKKVSFLESIKTFGIVPKPLYDAFSHYTGFELKTFVNVYNYLIDILDGRKFSDLVKYELIYKGRPCTLLPENSKSDYETFLTNPFPVRSVADKLLLYDGLCIFENFDHALFIIKLVKVYFSYLNYIKRVKDRISEGRMLASLSGDNDKIKTHYKLKSISQFSNLFNYESNL